jgi:CRP/FNR family transcriptional regulator, cyclic AMP receptor protein
MQTSNFKTKQRFSAERYLQTSGAKRKIVEFQTGETIFSQGDSCSSVYYLQRGRVKISVTAPSGKEAVIALLRGDDFFGEGCIAGQPLHIATATALKTTTVLAIEKAEAKRMLQRERAFSNVFVAHMLKRNVRIEEDLLDQLFNASEKRLARALLLIARYGKDETNEDVVDGISQQTLAAMIGTTRGRVSFFMNKFRKLGLIKYNGSLQVNSSLLRVVLHD